MHITVQSLQVDINTVDIIQTYENHAFVELDDELFYQFLTLIMIQLHMKDFHINVCSTQCKLNLLLLSQIVASHNIFLFIKKNFILNNRKHDMKF